MSKLDFYQKSPFTNHWYPEDIDICNNPAQKFGFRVLKDNVEIYQDIDMLTSLDWNLESFDFTGDANFEYSNGAVFTFELAAYDKNDVNCWNNIINQEPVMWDLDDVKVFGCCVSEEICGNGIDDDGDGYIDNADSECNIVYRTTPSPCTVTIPASGSSNHTVTSTLSITESGIIEDLNVASLEILHSYIDDLNITLTSPAGTSVLIMNKPCGNHTNMSLTLDDEATVSFSTNCPPTDNARYTPDNPLSSFDGEEVNGDWILTVEDIYPSADGGSIECWSLEFDIESTPSLEICDNNIDDDGDGLTDEDCPTNNDCPNDLANNEFNNGTDDWWLSAHSGGDATFTIDNANQLSGTNSAKIDISSVSGTDWHIQFGQGGKQLEAGKIYTFSFDAKAAGNRNMTAMLQIDASPWTTYFWREVPLTTTVTTYTYTIHANNTLSNNLNLLFNLGVSNQDVWIDNVFFGETCDAYEICDNGIDDDFDGMIDCDDSDCSPDGANIFDGCITVNSTGDEGDTNPGDGKCMTVNCDCTLRAAIEEANALAGKDTICYDIPVPGMDYDGTKWTITPMSLFENLTEAVFIDGYTQTGSVMATADAAAILKIKINGAHLPADGAIFQTTADGSKLAGMVISGNDVSGNSCGVNLQSGNNEIVGNCIGVNEDGSTGFANGTGVLVNGSNNKIGGIYPADANIIAQNNGAGIEVVNVGSNGNTILRNSFTGNGGIAIDLASGNLGDDVTENDENDADDGANNLLNFPDLKGIAVVSGDVYYDFILDVPAGDYRIELFSNAIADASGHGEGRTFIGALNINHTGTGQEQFYGDFTPLVPTAIGDYITLTATQCTDATCTYFYQTSEFNGYIESERCDDLTDSGSITGDEEGCTISFDPGLITSVSEGTGGEGGPVYYQWQELPEGNTVWKDIIGATETSYDPTPISVNTSYRRQAIRAKCSATWQTSNVVTKTIGALVNAEIITAPSGQNGFICGAAAYEFEAADAAIGVVYTWNFGENANPQFATGKGPHLIGFLTPTDSLAILNDVVLEASISTCAAYDTTSFSINPVVYSSEITFTNPTTCGAADGTIQVAASGGKNLCIKVSLDGGATYQPDGQLSFIGLSANTYDVVLNYCNIDCPNRYGVVTLSEPTQMIVVNDEIQNACPGFGFEGSVTYNDRNVENGIYSILTNPTKGLVEMDTAGAFEFTPTVFECGTDQFIYQVCHRITNCCATGVVTLNFQDELIPELQNIPVDLTIN
ncbi:MAG: carbohydrate binding domain-containing protein, partial [Saprospiraceae bacterium]